MSRRTDNDSRDRTRNVRRYIVRYEMPGSSRSLDFHTTDKRQARRKASEYAGLGWPVQLLRHNGVGRWEALEIPEAAS